MQPRAAAEPAHLELVGAELRRDAAVGRHRPLAGRRDDRDDDAVVAVDLGTEHADAVVAELLRDELARRVVRALRDQSPLAAELGRPRGDVRRLAARAGARAGGRVGAEVEGAVEAHDDVEQEISQGAHHHGDTIVPWTSEGASRSSALVRDRRRRRRVGHDRRGPSTASEEAAPPRSPAGLAAFEDAPCYREIVELEERETPGRWERRTAAA